MKDFENKRINERLKEFKKDVKGSKFLGVPITELNKSQLEKLACFLNSKINKYLNIPVIPKER